MRAPAAPNPLTTAVNLGLLHALVDAASLAVLYAEMALERLPDDEIWWLIVVYNVLAFGLQCPLGLVADRYRVYKATALIGLASVLVAVIISPYAVYPAVGLVGVGNALFHLGAGAIVLALSGGQATTPGLFVAPGAAGVAAGIWLGLAGFPQRGLMGLTLAGALVLLVFLRVPLDQLSTLTGVAQPVRRGRHAALAAIVAAILLVSVALRSLLSDVLVEPWRGTQAALALTLAAVAGKALGGAFADRVGWKTWAVATMVLAVPWMPWTSGQWPLATLSMLLIQMTMAVTLAAVYVVLPSHPAVAFGLPSLAILLGAVPGFAWPTVGVRASPYSTLLVLGSVVLLWLGLRLLPVGQFSGQFPSSSPGRREAQED
jgi:FSR family fosmidomycin resistance protein-like MFS transporter